jgi:hypothetical protein
VFAYHVVYVAESSKMLYRGPRLHIAMHMWQSLQAKNNWSVFVCLVAYAAEIYKMLNMGLHLNISTRM